jgi:hypothetical protein
VTILDAVEKAESLLSAIPEVTLLNQEALPVNGGRTRLEFTFSGDDQALSRLLAQMVQAGIPLVHFSGERRDMEEVFMRATKGLVT